MLARLYATASRIYGWLRRRRADDEFTEELHAHLSLLTDEYVRRGMRPDEAARAARVRLGGITQIREERAITADFRCSICSARTCAMPLGSWRIILALRSSAS